MGQRVLAENAGVMRVGYVLPNKHYIPVDMKYIGVDNTTPYVPISWFGRIWNSVWGFRVNGLKGLSLFWKCHLPRVVEQKLMGDATGVVSFFSIEALSLIFCHPLIGYASRAWSTDVSPFYS